METKFGEIQSGKITATYKVNAGCTGTLNGGVGSTYSFVLYDGNTRFRILNNVQTNDNLGGIGVAQGTVTCMAAGLNGTFVGGVLPAGEPDTSFEQITFDGKGGKSSIGPESQLDAILINKVTGTYKVDSHCIATANNKYTVTANGKLQESGTSHSASILVRDGMEFLSVGTDSDSAGLSVYQK